MRKRSTFFYRPSAMRVLLALRQRGASDFPSLCRVFGFEPCFEMGGATLSLELQQVVLQLYEAGLIVVENPETLHDRWSGPQGAIKLADSWLAIQQALGLSLKEMAQTDPQHGMFVGPIFGKPETVSSKDGMDLFILMPFREDINPVYEDHIKAVATKLKLRVKRGDDFFTAHNVMHDIWNAICGARIIIADCTGRNPNVFYEIGIAHTIGKPVILVTQNIDDIPFDLRYIRYIQYQLTPRGMRQFEETLTATIKQELD